MFKESNSIIPEYVIQDPSQNTNIRLFLYIHLKIQQNQTVQKYIVEQFQIKGRSSIFQGKKQKLYLNPKQSSKYKIEQSCVVYFSEDVIKLNDFQGIASDLLSSAYKFDRTSTQKKKIQVILANLQNKQLIADVILLTKTKNRSKQWANGRGDTQGSPQYFVREAEKIQVQHQIKITIIKGDDLLDQSFRLLHAVGRASSKQPIFINLAYNGNRQTTKYLALIGKGVCFDSGGINIKSTSSMLPMFLDKQGACSVLSAFQQIVKQKLPINITCSIGLVQNFISSNSYRPGDIIKSRKGLTVKIEDTDAQGRLVLADVMNWTQQNFIVQTIIELSTLTYSNMIGLGHKYAGMYGNCHILKKDLIKSGQMVHQYVWQMPTDEEFMENLECNEADLKSDNSQGMGGGSIGAVFLQNFVQKQVKWVHLDILGVGILNNQGTGWGSRLIVHYCRNMARKSSHQREQK